MRDSLPSLVLYDFPALPADARWSTYSPFVLEIAHALQLAKIPFRRERVAYPRIRQLNKLAQLPVVRIGTELVADSTRILRRIEALVPGSLTAGLDARLEAEAWLWEEFADTALYPYVLATRWIDERGFQVVRRAFFGTLPLPVRAILPSFVRRGMRGALIGRDFLRGGLSALHERLAQTLVGLETRAPETGFWLGPQVTVADVGLFAHLHSLRLPETPWRAAEIARHPKLSRWLDRVEEATQPAAEASASSPRSESRLN